MGIQILLQHVCLAALITPSREGFFFIFFLLRISFDSCCTAEKSRHQNKPAAANNRGKAEAL